MASVHCDLALCVPFSARFEPKYISTAMQETRQHACMHGQVAKGRLHTDSTLPSVPIELGFKLTSHAMKGPEQVSE